jgi:hypothetical protein
MSSKAVALHTASATQTMQNATKRKAVTSEGKDSRRLASAYIPSRKTKLQSAGV